MNEANYFAVVDPASKSMSFWFRNRRGVLVAWPRGSSFEPVLWKSPGPGREHVIPAGLEGAERFEWLQNWHWTVRQPWFATIKTSIEADPVAAAACFAALQTSCSRCGRHLEDVASRARALGSDCVTRFSPEYVASLTREVGRALAARDAGDEDGALINRSAAYADATGRLRDAEDAA